MGTATALVVGSLSKPPCRAIVSFFILASHLRAHRIAKLRGIMNFRSDENRGSPLKAWVRALERTAPIERRQSPTLPVLIDHLAEQFEAAPALVSRGASLSYRELAGTANRYARWALQQGLAPGEVVCLFMPNCPDYLAIWLGLTRVGLIVSLLNTSLT